MTTRDEQTRTDFDKIRRLLDEHKLTQEKFVASLTYRDVDDARRAVPMSNWNYWKSGGWLPFPVAEAVARRLNVGVSAICDGLPEPEFEKHEALVGGFTFKKIKPFNHIRDVIARGRKKFDFYASVLHFDRWPRHENFARRLRWRDDEIGYRVVRVTLPPHREKPLRIVLSAVIQGIAGLELRMDFGLIRVEPNGALHAVAPFLCDDITVHEARRVRGDTLTLVFWAPPKTPFILHTPETRDPLEIVELPGASLRPGLLDEATAFFPRAPHHKTAAEFEAFRAEWSPILKPPVTVARVRRR